MVLIIFFFLLPRQNPRAHYITKLHLMELTHFRWVWTVVIYIRDIHLNNSQTFTCPHGHCTKSMRQMTKDRLNCPVIIAVHIIVPILLHNTWLCIERFAYGVRRYIARCPLVIGEINKTGEVFLSYHVICINFPGNTRHLLIASR